METTKKSKTKKWERLYAQAEKMASENRGHIYDRIKLLVEIYKDQTYQHDAAARNLHPTQYLDRLVSDTFADFQELNTLYLEFPTREQWESMGIREMRQVAAEKARMARKARDDGRAAGNTSSEKKAGGGTRPGPDDPTRRLSWKARYLKRERDYDILKGMYDQLKDMYDELKADHEKLLQDYRRLQDSLSAGSSTN